MQTFHGEIIFTVTCIEWFACTFNLQPDLKVKLNLTFLISNEVESCENINTIYYDKT